MAACDAQYALASTRATREMMSIEDRVIESMRAGIENRFDLGISTICPAIEATAKKKYSVSKLGRSGFIQFIRDNYDLIGPFVGAGLDFGSTKFSFLKIQDDKQNLIRDPDLAEVVYYIFRCGAAHGDDPNPLFELTTNDVPGLVEWRMNFETGSLQIPQQLLWGLIAPVLFCDANKDAKTISDFYLAWHRPHLSQNIEYRFPIDVFWGGESTVRAFFQKVDLIKVEMKF